ncbi:hypothetical protein, partial [Janthinobacterium sp. CAN_S7]|uniref:hypothetical protein n=1 Tax=Janthinobacterium sp. CAN_S7 TaxID=3071704 RepID=UPI00319E344C
MKIMSKLAAIALVSHTLLTNATAAPQWWQQVYPTNSNSQITLKDENNNNVTAITNPTAAKVKLSANTNTQPPSIIIQATASLPIKVVGDPCTASTTGSNPNQTANEGAAITADRSLLLSCQSGV